MKTVKIFNDVYETKIPVDFSDMSNDLIEKKYPMNNRPQIVKTDALYQVDFKFSIINIGTSDNVTDYVNENVKKIVLQTNQGYIFREDICFISI